MLALLRLFSLLGRRPSYPPGRDGLSELADPGRLPSPLAEVVQLGPPNSAPGDDLDPRDGRRVDGERSLDTDPERDLPNGEGLAHPAPLAADHDALEHLDPLPAGLGHADVDPHGIARPKLRQVVPQTWLLDQID